MALLSFLPRESGYPLLPSLVCTSCSPLSQWCRGAHRSSMLLTHSLPAAYQRLHSISISFSFLLGSFPPRIKWWCPSHLHLNSYSTCSLSPTPVSPLPSLGSWKSFCIYFPHYPFLPQPTTIWLLSLPQHWKCPGQGSHWFLCWQIPWTLQWFHHLAFL